MRKTILRIFFWYLIRACFIEHEDYDILVLDVTKVPEQERGMLDWKVSVINTCFDTIKYHFHATTSRRLIVAMCKRCPWCELTYTFPPCAWSCHAVVMYGHGLFLSKSWRAFVQPVARHNGRRDLIVAVITRWEWIMFLRLSIRTRALGWNWLAEFTNKLYFAVYTADSTRGREQPAKSSLTSYNCPVT